MVRLIDARDTMGKVGYCRVQVVCRGIVGAGVENFSVEGDIGGVGIRFLVDDEIFVEAANISRADVQHSIFNSLYGTFASGNKGQGVLPSVFTEVDRSRFQFKAEF